MGPRASACADRVEFGNYIGGDLDSDDESDVEIAPAAVPAAPGPSAAAVYAPLEGFEEDEDEDMEEDEGTGMEMTLHGVDGECGEERELTLRHGRESGCTA